MYSQWELLYEALAWSECSEYPVWSGCWDVMHSACIGVCAGRRGKQQASATYNYMGETELKYETSAL